MTLPDPETVPILVQDPVVTIATNPKIRALIEENAVNDLRAAYTKRDRLNNMNMVFHFWLITSLVVSAFLITLARVTESDVLNLTGIGMVYFTLLVRLFEGIADAMLNTLLVQIKQISRGEYIDSENILRGLETQMEAIQIEANRMESKRQAA